MRKQLFFFALSVYSISVIGQTPDPKLNFDTNNFSLKTISFKTKILKVRAYENIVYVSNPVDTIYQKINIYIPEEYFQDKIINGYNALDAPIFLPNQIGGYMSARPGSTEAQGMMARSKTNTIVEALAHGYIVASPGARGRTIGNGKAPSAIVDLKAAVRYLKYNDKRMPGDANKIISNGTSAGGALSTLLGATGNNTDYEPYLKALGAAPAKDDIFAVSAYCPITNLEHADMAYEWQFSGRNTFTAGGPMAKSTQGPKTLSTSQIKISEDLKVGFPGYVNKLKLKDSKRALLTLDAKGDGSFKDLVKSYVIASANAALEKGIDLGSFTSLTIANGKVTNLDWDKYIDYMQRQKTPPAFDPLDLSSPENELFGTAKIGRQHFTEYGMKHSTSQEATMANQQIIKMMNPMYYIGAKKTITAQHWRIRHGSKDKDGSLATPVLLGTLLLNKGYDVDLALPWDKPHSGDYDLEELFSWIDKVCK